MKSFREFKKWIRTRIPEDITDQDLDNCGIFWHYYYDSLTIFCNGDRDDYRQEYVAKDRADLRLWAYKKCCMEIAYGMELANREENEPKWRYLMDHVEDGEWVYVENKNYVYNTVEDTRLVCFEEYLRMIKGNVPEDDWEKEVQKYLEYMNVDREVPHWGYDREKMVYVEISEEPFPKKEEKPKEEIEEKAVYFTRDSFCMADDVCAPNIRRFQWRETDWYPECDFYGMIDAYFGTHLPGYYWRGFAGGKWIADINLVREACGFKKECTVAENWRELLRKHGCVHFVHEKYEDREELPQTLKRGDYYTYKQAEKIYKSN